MSAEEPPVTALEELDRQRRALEVAIGYSPVRVSIAGHPGIGYTHRTAEDRDDLVTRILDAGFRVGPSQ